jgi:hypothetical protein
MNLPEPVLIDFSGQHWQHPDIAEMLNWETDGTNIGKWSYDHLYRVYFENNNKETAYIVIHWPDKEWKDISLDELADVLPVVLFEDVWCPGGKQFCFTKLGKELSDKFFNSYITFASPDVGIEDVQGDYSWSS